MPKQKDNRDGDTGSLYDLDLDLSMDLDMDMGNMDSTAAMNEEREEVIEEIPVMEMKTLGLERARELIPYADVPPQPPVDTPIEEQMNKGVSETLSHIRATAHKAIERMNANATSIYFCTIVFLDHVQMDAFMKATEWYKFGQPDIDGIRLAKHLGVELPKSAYRPHEVGPDKMLGHLAMTADELIPDRFEERAEEDDE